MQYTGSVLHWGIRQPTFFRNFYGVICERPLVLRSMQYGSTILGYNNLILDCCHGSWQSLSSPPEAVSPVFASYSHGLSFGPVCCFLSWFWLPLGASDQFQRSSWQFSSPCVLYSILWIGPRACLVLLCCRSSRISWCSPHHLEPINAHFYIIV